MCRKTLDLLNHPLLRDRDPLPPTPLPQIHDDCKHEVITPAGDGHWGYCACSPEDASFPLTAEAAGEPDPDPCPRCIYLADKVKRLEARLRAAASSNVEFTPDTCTVCISFADNANCTPREAAADCYLHQYGDWS